jgi:hypothetical protein
VDLPGGVATRGSDAETRRVVVEIHLGIKREQAAVRARMNGLTSIKEESVSECEKVGHRAHGIVNRVASDST